MKIGVLPLGRPTFDVPFAEEKLSEMLILLDQSGHEIVGSRTLLMDADQAALEAISDVDLVLVLQVTFTDAAFVVEASKLDIPMAIWAIRLVSMWNPGPIPSCWSPHPMARSTATMTIPR